VANLPSSLYYASLKPNSITLSGANQLRTSFEPDSVMEFGLYTIGIYGVYEVCYGVYVRGVFSV